MHVRAIDPMLLDADPAGVREDPGDVSGLAATIADYGLLQPIGVVAGDAGRYTVVYGNRRRVAALELGLSSVPTTSSRRAPSPDCAPIRRRVPTRARSTSRWARWLVSPGEPYGATSGCSSCPRPSSTICAAKS